MINHIVTLALLLIFISSCSDEHCNVDAIGLTKTVTLENGDMISLPESYTVEPVTGRDTYFGYIVSEDNNFEVMYDMGQLAGSYVTDGYNCTESENTMYCSKQENQKHLVTFQDCGPANFVFDSKNSSNQSIFYSIMNSYRKQVIEVEPEVDEN